MGFGSLGFSASELNSRFQGLGFGNFIWGLVRSCSVVCEVGLYCGHRVW